MNIKRREFLGAASALVAGMTQRTMARTQQEGGKPPSLPTRPAKVERLYKAPDIHPNALEAAPDGLWIGDQVSEKVFKVDWQSGKVLHEVQTESHNTSGVAVGARYLWLGANGGVSGRRRPRDHVRAANPDAMGHRAEHSGCGGGRSEGLSSLAPSSGARRSPAWTRLGQRRALGSDCWRPSGSEDRSGLGPGARGCDTFPDRRPGSAWDVHPRRLYVLLRCGSYGAWAWQRAGTD